VVAGRLSLSVLRAFDRGGAPARCFSSASTAHPAIIDGAAGRSRVTLMCPVVVLASPVSDTIAPGCQSRVQRVIGATSTSLEGPLLA
jgi:hypothetical protein